MYWTSVAIFIIRYRLWKFTWYYPIIDWQSRLKEIANLWAHFSLGIILSSWKSSCCMQFTWNLEAIFDSYKFYEHFLWPAAHFRAWLIYTYYCLFKDINKKYKLIQVMGGLYRYISYTVFTCDNNFTVILPISLNNGIVQLCIFELTVRSR